MNYELKLAKRIDIFNSITKILQKTCFFASKAAWVSMDTSATLNLITR